MNNNDVVVYCDGWIKDGGGCSVAIYSESRIVHKKKYLVPEMKNMTLKKFMDANMLTVPVAEYFAVYTALRIIKSQPWMADEEKVILYSDAENVVYQLNDYREVNNYVLRRWYNLCKKIKLENVQILWISRKKMVETLGH